MEKLIVCVFCEPPSWNQANLDQHNWYTIWILWTEITSEMNATGHFNKPCKSCLCWFWWLWSLRQRFFTWSLRSQVQIPLQTVSTVVPLTKVPLCTPSVIARQHSRLRLVLTIRRQSLFCFWMLVYECHTITRTNSQTQVCGDSVTANNINNCDSLMKWCLYSHEQCNYHTSGTIHCQPWFLFLSRFPLFMSLYT